MDRAGALAMISAAASLVIGTVFSLDAYASPGTLIETGDELLFITVGIGVLLRAPAKYHAGAALGLGAVSLAVGLINGAVFSTPSSSRSCPGTAVHLVVLVSIAAGFDAARLGCLHFVRPAHHPRRPLLGWTTRRPFWRPESPARRNHSGSSSNTPLVPIRVR